ncbi:adenylyltransferase/cytidyltransferase family protein [Thiothrix subterranea]|uniref:adenylyltransferase/cytidyltransferase family protein n=1 Tax=Thiothrix subterranea TaxID=2735563 RepID=UPI00280AE551|nr:adenylyltransferase/cytidyltransferase family protein [Thiothrix subterranea]
MFKPDFDFLVFIGRFQPFHAGHQAVVETALQRAERVIVLVGSSCQPRTLRNPWTFAERETFIRATFPEAGERLILAPLLDDTYNEQGWITRVQQTVHGITCRFPPKVGSAAPRVGLIGHSKDHSSYYLSMFPQWQSVRGRKRAWGIVHPVARTVFPTGCCAWRDAASSANLAGNLPRI